MEKTIRNAIVHNVNFALRPGPHWKIPPVLDRLLTERARQDFGESWWDDPLLREKLDSSFETLLSYGPKRTAPKYDSDLVAAYTFGFLPIHFPKVAELLSQRFRHKDFPEKLRVLDLGCGPGTASLSCQYFFALLANARTMYGEHKHRYRLDIVQIDRNEQFLEEARKLSEAFLPSKDNVVSTIEKQHLMDLHPENPSALDFLGERTFDLILVQDFFGEMRELSVGKRKELLDALSNLCNDEGSLLIVERTLGGRVQEFHQLVSKALQGEGCHLFAPCPGIFDAPHGVKCYSCRASLHRSIVRPRFLELLCRASSQYDYESIDENNLWCYAILGRNNLSAAPPLPSDLKDFSQLSNLSGQGSETPERVNLLASVAARLPDKPNTYKLCDQSCGSEYNRLHIPGGRLIGEFQRGDVLELRSIRVEKEEDPDEGTILLHLYVDGSSNISNLSRENRRVSWRDCLEGLGYRA